ncbi:MAG: prolyl aminopeptidase, partial [Rhodospirillales bacterium]
MMSTDDAPLYGEIEPYDRGRLSVSGGHEIYFEQCGNPDGKPALFVHGGPGGGCTNDDRRFFDPEAYRIILFDQRGAGRSRPHAGLRENTTGHLIADMERLRERLGIARWLLFGGSWGSTLSLAYAEAHPRRVSEMILRGIFLLRRWELDWYYRDATPHVFPEAARRFQEHVPACERGDLVAAYHKRVNGTRRTTRDAALREWARWEAETSSLYPDPNRIEKYSDPEFAAAFAGIELHYFANRGFFETDGQLLERADSMADIPGVIVHGRYDMVCPVQNAIDLKTRWDNAELQIVPDAGHASSEPGIARRLVAAT